MRDSSGEHRDPRPFRKTSEARGHAVTAIARDVGGITERDGLRVVAGDADDPTNLAPILAGHDAVASAVMFMARDRRKLLEAVRGSGVKRYLIVGGAGSLRAAAGVDVLDTPDFPETYHAEASKGCDFLNLLKAEVCDLYWTMLSPSALFVSGARTGTYRLVQDGLLVEADGKSWISYPDYAIAFVDELETPALCGGDSTVGY